MAAVNNLCAISVILLISAIICETAEVFNPKLCLRGCRKDANCPKNSSCIPLTVDSDCGYCLCNEGFEPVGVGRCKLQTSKSREKVTKTRKGISTSSSSQSATFSSGQAISTLFSTETSTQQSTSTVFSSTIRVQPLTQGPIPSAETLNCRDYDCDLPAIKKDKNETDPLKIRVRQFNASSSNSPGCNRKLVHNEVICNNQLASSSTGCYGRYCLDIDIAKSYCICPFDKVGETCNEDKPGRCLFGNGLMPANNNVQDDRKFVHKNLPDQGAIIARHFADSLTDCVKLCQWMNGPCKSVNFGLIGETKICELLSVAVPNNSDRLKSWLIEAFGWTYACCF